MWLAETSVTQLPPRAYISRKLEGDAELLVNTNIKCRAECEPRYFDLKFRYLYRYLYH